MYLCRCGGLAVFGRQHMRVALGGGLLGAGRAGIHKCAQLRVTRCSGPSSNNQIMQSAVERTGSRSTPCSVSNACGPTWTVGQSNRLWLWLTNRHYAGCGMWCAWRPSANGTWSATLYAVARTEPHASVQHVGMLVTADFVARLTGFVRVALLLLMAVACDSTFTQLADI